MIGIGTVLPSTASRHSAGLLHIMLKHSASLSHNRQTLKDLKSSLPYLKSFVAPLILSTTKKRLYTCGTAARHRPMRYSNFCTRTATPTRAYYPSTRQSSARTRMGTSERSGSMLIRKTPISKLSIRQNAGWHGSIQPLRFLEVAGISEEMMGDTTT